MMKRLLIIALTISSLTALAQIPGKKVPGPHTITGVELYENDTLTLGTGSAPYGGFKFIYQPANYLASVGAQALPSSFNSRKLAIKFFKVEESRKFGRKVWVVVAPAVYNYAVDFESAVGSGEIVAVNGRQLLGNASAAPTASTTFSVADELIKLKQLYDAGALTKDEYDQQKKKVLERQ